MTRLSISVFLIWTILALFSGLLTISPNQVDLNALFATPFKFDHLPLGGDELGRSLLDRLIAGAQVSFFVALISVSLSTLIGTAIGIIAAYFGGWVDRLISRIIDIFLAFPGLLLAIAMAGMLGPGIDNVIIALAMMGWVGFARLARSQVMSLKQRDHVLAATALGQPTLRIMQRHLLPFLAAPLLVEASYGVASAVIAEAGLSFLGLGVQPPQASWGSMIREGVRYLLIAPHLVLVPGIALSLIVLSSNLLGDALRDHWDVISHSKQ